jgi:hypothetical protein
VFFITSDKGAHKKEKLCKIYNEGTFFFSLFVYSYYSNIKQAANIILLFFGSYVYLSRAKTNCLATRLTLHTQKNNIYAIKSMRSPSQAQTSRIERNNKASFRKVCVHFKLFHIICVCVYGYGKMKFI